MQTVRQEVRQERERSPRAAEISRSELERAFRARVRGEVDFGNGARGLYATDGSNYRLVPMGVVLPRDPDDLAEAADVCHQLSLPVLLRGGGVSLSGQTCNVAVVLDVSKHLTRIVELDPERRLARVQPGLIPDNLNREAEKHRLLFCPVPATHAWNTIGGMVGNNSCGIRSVMGGKTVDNVEELEIVTYDGLRMRVGRTSDEELDRIIREGGRRGAIYARLRALRDRYANLIRERYPRIPRRVSGYNLDELLPENGFHVARALVGSEGTCATVLEATLNLIYSPPVRSLLVLGYPDAFAAGDHVPLVLEHRPTALEGIDDRLLANMHKKGTRLRDIALLPPGGGFLLVEFGGESKEEADGKARDLMARLARGGNLPSMKLFDDPAREQMIWDVREAGLGATAHVPGEKDTWPGWEDSAAPPERIGDYLRDLRKLLDRYGYACALYGHYGQGCIHTRIDFDLKTAEGIRSFRSFMEEAADLVLGYGGSLSGEHGDGQARSELLPKMFGPELVEAFREFRSIWDPEGKMNPGVIVDPYPITGNLRLGTSYEPPSLETHFRYPEDGGTFSGAMLRCVGIGKCRRESGGVMCPSYMVTHEEQHSTRGRARLLFEMLQGQELAEGWRSESVKQALDLCLACKGCKGDCPVNVDMATYKAEFLAHYYQGRLRPPSAYLFGMLPFWAPLAARVPGLVNFFTQTPVLRDIGKALVGMAPQREIPAFAPQTFRAWFRERGPRNLDRSEVILWPDEFNDYFRPEVLQAGAEVLEAAGYHVSVPQENLSSGRSLYDYGLIDQAKSLLRQTLSVLRPQIRAGVPIVGLEPSVVSVFRDELTNLFPDDEDAKRLSQQSYLLGEFLVRKAEGYQPPQLKRKAVVHGHCHHKSILAFGDEQTLLSKLGLDLEVLDSGCCGQAGAFGYEKDHYDVAMKAGERVLLPAVRSAAKDTLVIADGFSCREQISHATDRRALHLAQVIQMAMREGPDGPQGDYPESGYYPERERGLAIGGRSGLAIGLAALVGGFALSWWLRRARR